MTGSKTKPCKKRPLSSLSEKEFNMLKATGMLWEIYPDAPGSWAEMPKKK